MSTNDRYAKGSEWRKWDLHVHTPASLLNNGFGSDWDGYVKRLFTTLIDKNIAVVGFTDYFNIDGYKRLSEEYLANDAKLATLFTPQEVESIKKILVLPNIEFRSDIFVGTNSVNFHVIFSEVVPVKDIEEKFLHEIDFLYQGEPQTEDKKRKLKETNLRELGAQLKKEHAAFKGSDLLTGMMNAVVDDKQVSKILSDKESIFGGKYLFGVMADEDLSAIGWNSRDHLTRKVLIQKSDVLFSSNPSTRQWGLGKPPFREGPAKFIAEFKTLKPCVHGSDAHEFAFIGHPCAKRGRPGHNCSTSPADCDLRFCWIKAEPTFEGLKQILYEPEDRVAIRPTDPTPLKSSQCLAEFGIGPAAVEPELAFSATRIPLNEGLVAVTGGKGSGKTALVDLIANMYEDRAFCSDKNSFAKRISVDDGPDLNTTIKLQSGDGLTKEVKTGTFLEGASVVYVAQGELERHVEDPAQLETYINRLIFESNEVKDSALLFDYENINAEVGALSDILKSSNKKIFSLENETDPRIEEGLTKDGKQLATDLQDTQNKIAELAKGLSPEKIQEAEAKQKQLTELRDGKTRLNDLGITIKNTLKFVEDNFAGFNSGIAKINQIAAELKLGGPFQPLEYPPTASLQALIIVVRDEARKTIGEIEKFQKDLEEKERGIKEHAKLLDKKKELEKSIQLLKDTLAFLATRKLLLAEEIDKRAESFRQLLAKRVEQRNKYLAIIAAFAANKHDILNDLEFTAELVFDRHRFIETMAELVDLRKIRIKVVSPSESDIAFFIDAMLVLSADPTDAKVQMIASTGIKDLLAKIVPNKRAAETISRHTIYDSVFADYLGVTPTVKYKKVRISKLSLGQKATVLLKIYLAQGENPIIIDSHDDHLDNEFIMDELVKALRQAKQHRQIIIVSNNGNVVVNSDAEQVVIAGRDNQGQISYVSGALENPVLRARLLEVLEGGEEAFSKRQQKYRLGN
jgi:energy-coupling factor transporter ATP-binding protein EcfA2